MGADSSCESTVLADGQKSWGITLASGLALASTGTVTVPAYGAETLDQSSSYNSTSCIEVSDDYERAQIFTAGLSGALSKISLGLYKQGTVTNLTVAIYATSGSTPTAVPTGAALASHAVTLADVPSTRGNEVTVEFTSPISISAGTPYALVATTTDSFMGSGGDYQWCFANSYADGNIAYRSSGSSSFTVGLEYVSAYNTFTFATYVDVGGEIEPSDSSSAAAPPIALSLSPKDGTNCRSTSQAGTAGTWVGLPCADDCTPPATQSGATLLGWATSPDFPVEIAQRQVDNGWGAYETFNEDGHIASVFIPAGGSTLVSAPGTLFTIWSQWQ